MRKGLLAVLALTFLALPTPLRADPEAKAIIEKAIKAYGGEEKLAAVKAIRVKSKGTVEVMGQSYDFTSEGISSLDGKMHSELQLDIMGQKITVVQCYNGKMAWLAVANNTQELKDDLLKELRQQTHHSRVNTLVPLLKDDTFTLSPLGEIQVDGKPAVGVKVSAKDFRDIELYFDKTTGLIAKMIYQAFDTSTMKEVSREVFTSEFKESNGLKYASKMRMLQDGKKFVDADVTEQKYADTAPDDSEFAKP